MSVNSNQLEEFARHLLEGFWVSVLEISERLPEPKRACAPKRTKDDCQRITFAPTAEVVDRRSCQRETPLFAT